MPPVLRVQKHIEGQGLVPRDWQPHRSNLLQGAHMAHTSLVISCREWDQLVKVLQTSSFKTCVFLRGDRTVKLVQCLYPKKG